MYEKQVRLNSSRVARQVRRNGDFLQKLTDIGFELEADTRHVWAESRSLIEGKQYIPVRLLAELEKMHNKLKRVVAAEADKWATMMIESQPDVVLQAALIWLGDYYCIKKDRRRSWAPPPWVGAYFINKEIFYERSSEVSFAERVIDGFDDCLSWFPEHTVEAVSLLATAHEFVFTEPRCYSSPRRIEGFFKKHLSYLDFDNTLLARVVEIENVYSLISDSGRDPKDLTLLVKIIYYYFCNNKYETKRLMKILAGFQKIVAMDQRFFLKYKKSQSLNIAASEACSIDDLKGRQRIAEAIDKVTNFEYSNLSERRAFFNKIDRRYIARVVPDEEKPAVHTFTLSEDEMAILGGLCKRFGVSKIEAINESVARAHKFRRRKRELEKSAGPLFNRFNIKRVSIRVSLEASKQLNDVNKVLGELKATKGKSVSKSAALGWALVTYAASIKQGPFNPLPGMFLQELVSPGLYKEVNKDTKATEAKRAREVVEGREEMEAGLRRRGRNDLRKDGYSSLIQTINKNNTAPQPSPSALLKEDKKDMEAKKGREAMEGGEEAGGRRKGRNDLRKGGWQYFIDKGSQKKGGYQPSPPVPEDQPDVQPVSEEESKGDKDKQ